MQPCQSAIRDKFLNECMTGARRTVLPAEANAAGQYFDLPDRTQRGLHGTAAALRVVSAGHPNSDLVRTVTGGIVRYLRDRESVELAAAGDDSQAQAVTVERLRHDSVNTIKQAETLYALTFVSNGLAECDDLKTQISTRLLDCGRDPRGWEFILGAGREPHPLPTAHALRALTRNGHSADLWLPSVSKALIDRSSRPRNDILTAAIDCFLLQVLLEVGDALTRKESKRIFDSLWSRLHRELTTLREVNVDFFDDDRQNFVRVPWQLHLAVAAAAVHPYRRYLSAPVQRMLRTVTSSVSGQYGFRYPESGEHLSTRTYGIVYDTVALLDGRSSPRAVAPNSLTSLVGAANLTMRVGRRVAFAVATLLALGVAAAGLWSWYHDDARSLGDLAPNFLSAAVLTALSYILAIRRR